MALPAPPNPTPICTYFRAHAQVSTHRLRNVLPRRKRLAIDAPLPQLTATHPPTQARCPSYRPRARTTARRLVTPTKSRA
jgi:hypothetical protein